MTCTKISSFQGESPNEEKQPKVEILKAARKQRGFLEYKQEIEPEVINKLIIELEPPSVEKEVPGLPAHLIFMAVRYADHINDERWMQRLLASAIKGIRTTVKVMNIVFGTSRVGLFI